MSSLGVKAHLLGSSLCDVVLGVKTHKGDLEMPLPTLTDVFMHYSAWEPSSAIRQLLYAILFLHSPKDNDDRVVKEIYHEGQRPFSLVQSPISFGEGSALAARLLGAIQHPSSFATLLDIKLSPWWELALYLITEWCRANGQPDPDSASVKNISDPKKDPTVEDKDLLAQIQGMLLSLKLLRDFIAADGPEEIIDDEPDLDLSFLGLLGQLKVKFGNMPGLDVETISRPDVGMFDVDALDSLLSKLETGGGTTQTDTEMQIDVDAEVKTEVDTEMGTEAEESAEAMDLD